MAKRILPHVKTAIWEKYMAGIPHRDIAKSVFVAEKTVLKYIQEMKNAEMARNERFASDVIEKSRNPKAEDVLSETDQELSIEKVRKKLNDIGQGYEDATQAQVNALKALLDSLRKKDVSAETISLDEKMDLLRNAVDFENVCEMVKGYTPEQKAKLKEIILSESEGVSTNGEVRNEGNDGRGNEQPFDGD